jgi:hypothetical protein
MATLRVAASPPQGLREDCSMDPANWIAVAAVALTGTAAVITVWQARAAHTQARAAEEQLDLARRRTEADKLQDRRKLALNLIDRLTDLLEAGNAIMVEYMTFSYHSVGFSSNTFQASVSFLDETLSDTLKHSRRIGRYMSRQQWRSTIKPSQK